MAAVTAQDVADFAGRGTDTEFVATAGKVLPVAVAMVTRYVRQSNVVPDMGEPLAAVVLSSAARLADNPTLVRDEQVGEYRVTPGAFMGWTLPELAILHSYRVRAR